MNSIKLKPYKSIKYRGSMIYLYKTRNRKFIESACYSDKTVFTSWSGLPTRRDLPKINDEGKNQPFNIFSSHYDFELEGCHECDSLPKEKSKHRELNAIDFSVSEEDAIALAKRSIDREVGDFAFLKENDISTHIYDRETGKAAHRWCPLSASPYRIGQTIEGHPFLEVSPYYKWQHEYAINYEGYAPALLNSIPYFYKNNCLIVTTEDFLRGWRMAEPLGVTMALIEEMSNS